MFIQGIIMITRIILLGALLSFSVFANDKPRESLKICADPHMLPYSNTSLGGYENKIAALFGKQLGIKVEYEFFPQRMGFIRNTLRAESEKGKGYKCDLVITVPSDFELATTTQPYYTSTYVLAYAKGRGLDGLTDPKMLGKFIKDKNLDIKIGLPDRGPGQLWVFYQELMPYMTPYQGHPGDPRVNPGQLMMEDIAKGKIGIAIVWGPTAGFYAKQLEEKEGTSFVLLPLKDEMQKNREMKFSYSMAMAVRYGDKAWKEKIQQLIDKNKEEIHQILMDYGIPLVKVQ